MRTLAAAVFSILLIGTASGFECPWGKEYGLEPVRWSAEQAGVYTRVRVGVKSTFDKDVTMVDAGVWFIDPLGRSASANGNGSQIDPDLKLPAKGAVISGANYMGLDRLVGAQFEDFELHICTRAVLFSDGTKIEP